LRAHARARTDRDGWISRIRYLNSRACNINNDVSRTRIRSVFPNIEKITFAETERTNLRTNPRDLIIGYDLAGTLTRYPINQLPGPWA